MITLQHSLCYLLTKDGDMEQFKKGIAYCLLPDAIRAYIGPRPYSHFEENPDGTDISWYKFPSDLKNLTRDSANVQESHLADISRKSCLGETTRVDKFIETNAHLEGDYYDGVLLHLIQDYIFDGWIRKNIDCSNKYEPNASFRFNDTTYDSSEIRKVIAKIEEYGFYYIAFICYQKYGVIANQEWFDENVFGPLKEAYPEDLAVSTYKYMKIPEDINQKITNLDWSGLNIKISDINYPELYENVIDNCKDTNLFFSETFKEKDKGNIKM